MKYLLRYEFADDPESNWENIRTWDTLPSWVRRLVRSCYCDLDSPISLVATIELTRVTITSEDVD